jgi:hypothetical protein
VFIQEVREDALEDNKRDLKTLLMKQIPEVARARKGGGFLHVDTALHLLLSLTLVM